MPRICNLTEEEVREHEARRFHRKDMIEFERDHQKAGFYTYLACGVGMPLFFLGIALLQNYEENRDKKNLAKHNTLSAIYQPYDTNKNGILEQKEADVYLREHKQK